jgi:hypothetical protein
MNSIYNWIYLYISNLHSDVWVFFGFWTFLNILFFFFCLFFSENRRMFWKSIFYLQVETVAKLRIAYICISLIPFFTSILGIFFFLFCGEMTFFELFSWCFFHLIWGPRWIYLYVFFFFFMILKNDFFSRIK